MVWLDSYMKGVVATSCGEYASCTLYTIDYLIGVVSYIGCCPAWTVPV